MPRLPGRPVDPAKRAAVVAAGWELFLVHGVDAAAMEAIAARAGVSKVTAYRYFPDKSALFEAGVLAEMERIEDAQRHARSGAADPPDAPVDIRARLHTFGLGIMHFLASPPAVNFYAVLAGELARRPDLARRFWNVGPGRTRANLVELIRDAVDRGELVTADPHTAADHLFGLWQGFTNLQYALAMTPAADVETRVDAAIEVFLRAYGVSERL